MRGLTLRCGFDFHFPAVTLKELSLSGSGVSLKELSVSGVALKELRCDSGARTHSQVWF